MIDQPQAIRLMIAIARTGSFAKGARELRLSPSSASRTIAALEQHLGVTLFLRTPRALGLTDAGASYLAMVEPILRDLGIADRSMLGDGNLQGTLRIGATSTFAARLIAPAMAEFMAAHPGLVVDIATDDRRQDLMQDAIDVAFRPGDLPDSTAIARLVARWPRIAGAAPAYLSRAGTPSHPDELRSHQFVLGGADAGNDLYSAEATFRFG